MSRFEVVVLIIKTWVLRAWRRRTSAPAEFLGFLSGFVTTNQQQSPVSELLVETIRILQSTARD